MRNAIPKDFIDAYYVYHIDKDNRRVFLDGEIDAESSSYIRRGILYLDSLDSSKPIELWVCSEGGSEYHMLSIYDTLRTVKCPIHTIATGMCFSAAPLLVAAGQKGKRYAMPHTFFMVHQSSDNLGQSRVDEQEIAMKHNKELGRVWSDLMANHSKLTPTQWINKCKKVGDYYFDASVAVDYGIVDQLWSEKD